MIRLLRILSDIAMVATFALGLWVAVYLGCLDVDFPLPTAFMNLSKQFFEPFLYGIRASYGVHVHTYGGHQVEDSYKILAVYCSVLFVVFLLASTFLHRLDYHSKLFFRDLRHRLFMQKAKKAEAKIERTPSGNVYRQETGAIVALKLENINFYPALEEMIRYLIRNLDSTQVIFDHTDYSLIKFNATSQSIQFVKVFYLNYKQTVKTLRLNFELKPVIRIAMHSLDQDHPFYEDESFIIALLKCVANNQIYLSATAKDQLETQMHKLGRPKPGIIQVGTFSQLGSQVFPDIYRLTSFGGEGEDVT